MILERRRKRSSFAGLALKYWFAAVGRRLGLEGLVLADDGGFVVASNLSPSEAEELAALAPLRAGDAARYAASAGPPMLVRQLMLGKIPLYLCAVGRGARSLGLQLAEGGVQRILAEA